MADPTLEQRLERAALAMPRLAQAVSRQELYREAARWLADTDGLAVEGAAILLLRGEDLVLAHSTFPQPGPSFRRDHDHRYARLARGEPAADSDAERLFPIAVDAEPSGHLVLRLSSADRRPDRIAGLSALARLVATHLARLAHALGDEAPLPSGTDLRGGLLSPAAFDAALAGELERARRYERPLSLLLVAAPFDPPSAAGRWLAGQVRAHDHVAHYRQDAFSALLPETSLEQAQAKAEALRAALAAQLGAAAEAAAIGVAHRRWDTDDGATLVRHASVGLELARRAGNAVFAWNGHPYRVPCRLATPLA